MTGTSWGPTGERTAGFAADWSGFVEAPPFDARDGEVPGPTRFVRWRAEVNDRLAQAPRS